MGQRQGAGDGSLPARIGELTAQREGLLQARTQIPGGVALAQPGFAQHRDRPRPERDPV